MIPTLSIWYAKAPPPSHDKRIAEEQHGGASISHLQVCVVVHDTEQWEEKVCAVVHDTEQWEEKVCVVVHDTEQWEENEQK